MSQAYLYCSKEAMRKILVSIIMFLLVVLGTVFTIRNTNDINPYGSQKTDVEPTPSSDQYTGQITSEQFIQGYEDGQDGIVMGTIKWIFSKDYRVGHMLGTHDKKKNIKRYTKSVLN